MPTKAELLDQFRALGGVDDSRSVKCTGCGDIEKCVGCDTCHKCVLCINCTNSENMLLCVDLHNKIGSYWLLNQEVTIGELGDAITELNS